MDDEQLVKLKDGEYGVIFIPGISKKFGNKVFKTLNIVVTEDGKLHAVRDDDMTPIELPIEE